MLWRIQLIDTYQYNSPSDDLYLRFELRNERNLTSMEVTLPWVGPLVDLMDALEREVREGIKQYLDIGYGN